MRITGSQPPQPTTAALRIGGAAALAFVVLLGISALVGPVPTREALHSAAVSPGILQSHFNAATPALTPPAAAESSAGAATLTPGP